MDKHYLKNIKLINKDFLELQAKYLPSKNSKTAILYCPGFGGGYGNIGDALSDYAQNKAYGFLFGQFQDSYDYRETVRYLDNGVQQNVCIGGTNARLCKSVADFDCFFNFLYGEGYEKVIAVGVCISASKLVYYLQHNEIANNMVKELILLAPQDFTDLRFSSVHIGLEEEAIINIKSGSPNKILSKKFLGYMDISSITFLDISLNKSFNTLSYKTNISKLKDLAKINSKILFVMGDLDYAIRNESKRNVEMYKDRLASNCRDGRFCIINGAKHLFKGKEAELIQVIDIFINSEIKELMDV